MSVVKIDDQHKKVEYLTAKVEKKTSELDRFKAQLEAEEAKLGELENGPLFSAIEAAGTTKQDVAALMQLMGDKNMDVAFLMQNIANYSGGEKGANEDA